MPCVDGRGIDARVGENDPLNTDSARSLRPADKVFRWLSREVASTRTLVTFYLPNWADAWLNFVLLEYCARAPASTALAAYRQPIRVFWIEIT